MKLMVKRDLHKKRNEKQKQSSKVFCKKVFLKISQNSQENTCVMGSTLLRKRF